MKKQFERFEFKRGQEVQQKIDIQNYINNSQAYVTCGLTDEGRPWVELSSFTGPQLNVILNALQQHLDVLQNLALKRN
jgi:hypothetical protein